MENIMEFPQKIKNRTTVWSSNPTSGYLSEGSEIRIFKRNLHPHVVAASFTIAKIWKPPKSTSMDQQIKENVTHTHHNGVSFSHKK